MKKKAVAQNAAYCITAHLGQIQETEDQFRRAWFGNLSPLFWRIPILLWALAVTSVSVASFWGPVEKFLLYMTHWGLIFIIVESIFGIIVTIKKPRAMPALRGFLFLYSTCALVASMFVPMTLDVNFGYWFIYMGSWGCVLMVFTEAFGIAVPAYVHFNRPIDATFGLPWYVKTYWVLYNITIPVAFLITIFYWGVLRTSVKKMTYAPHPVVDAMLHGVNSLVMLVELVCSAHPSRLLHIMQPLYFAGVYLLFSLLYFFAGGTDPWGNTFIYPVMDWSKPEQTLVVVTLTALFLGLMHLLTVGVAALRDLLARRCLRDTTGVYNDGFDA